MLHTTFVFLKISQMLITPLIVLLPGPKHTPARQNRFGIHKTHVVTAEPSALSRLCNVCTGTVLPNTNCSVCVAKRQCVAPRRLPGAAACQPPDVPETSHWRRVQQQAEWADYHRGFNAIIMRQPGTEAEELAYRRFNVDIPRQTCI